MLSLGALAARQVGETVADGAQTQHAGTLTFPVIQALVERDILTVRDVPLERTVRFSPS